MIPVNPMTYSEIISLVRAKLGEEDANNTAYDNVTLIKQMVNLAHEEFSSAFPFPWNETEADIVTVSTTLSSGYTAGGTSLVVTSSAGFGIGQRIWVTDGSNYERTTVSAVPSGVALTVSALAHDYAATTTYVCRETYELPYDLHRPAFMVDVAGVTKVKPSNVYRWRTKNPIYKTIGETPTDYILWGFDKTVEPVTSSLTMAADTDTDTVKCTTAMNLQADYYANWVLVNRTLSMARRVLSYTPGSTNILELRWPITGQVSGNTFHLEKRLFTFWFDSLLNTARRLRLWYYRIPVPAVQDYDIFDVPAAFHPDIASRAVAHLLCTDLKEQRADYYFGMSNAGLTRCRLQYGLPERYGLDDVPSMETEEPGYGESSNAFSPSQF